MWNLITTLEQTQKTWRKLLAMETDYAARMARIESRSLAETLAQYTEWYEMAGGSGDKIEWCTRLNDSTSRDSVFDKAIVPEITHRFELSRQAIRDSYNGFMCEACTEYYSDSPELLLTLHFRNNFAPDSPFEHIKELAEGLKRLVDDFTAAHPECHRVQCASWLNNRAEFLQFFPKEWSENRTVCLPMEGSQGWWGSFVNCKGEFNSKRAAIFQKNGGFSMPNVHCRCSIAALKEHIDQFVSTLQGKGVTQS